MNARVESEEKELCLRMSENPYSCDRLSRSLCLQSDDSVLWYNTMPTFDMTCAPPSTQDTHYTSGRIHRDGNNHSGCAAAGLEE